MTLGGVEEELVVLHQFLNSVQTDALIHVQHDGVEACDDVLLGPVLIAEMMVGPVHSILLGQHMKLVERNPFFEVVVRPVVGIRDNHLVNIRLLKRLPFEELDAVHKGLLDDDMLLVAPCRGKGHHLVPGRIARLVERQCLVKVCMGHFRAHRGDVLRQLHIGFLPVQNRLEGHSAFLHQLDGGQQMLHFDLDRLIHKGQSTSQLEGLEIPMRKLGLLDVLVLGQLIGHVFTVDLVGQKLDGDLILNHHFPAEDGRVSEVVEVVGPLVHRVYVALFRQATEDFLRGHVLTGPLMLAEAEQATSSIARF